MSRVKTSMIILLAMLAGGCAAVSEHGVTAPGAKVERLSREFEFTEGATCDPEGHVYFTDQPNDRIMKWSVDGELSVFMKPSNRSNGMMFDTKGNLYSCADEKNELWLIAPDKKVTVLVKEYKSKLLNAPNDVWLRPDGGLYFTDPWYKRDWWKRGPQEQEVEGVYHLAPERKEDKSDTPRQLTRVIDDLETPNGITGTPDGKALYVSDLKAQRTYVCDIRPDGSLTNKRLFCEMGSDGMTVDSEGNVYLTGKGVTVFNKAGKRIDHIDVPEAWSANVCFGGKDRKTLFITAGKGLYSVKMRVRCVNDQGGK